MDWENYFNKFLGEQIKTELEHCDLFIFRDDGIPLYSNRKVVNRESLGALMAGSFQAVKALSSFIPNLLDQEFFRFSYDASDCGIYILPFNLKKNHLFLPSFFIPRTIPVCLNPK